MCRKCRAICINNFDLSLDFELISSYFKVNHTFEWGSWRKNLLNVWSIRFLLVSISWKGFREMQLRLTSFLFIHFSSLVTTYTYFIIINLVTLWILRPFVWFVSTDITFSVIRSILHLFFRVCLQRSLEYCEQTLEILSGMSIEVTWHGKEKNEAAHYCSMCEVREWKWRFVIWCRD